MTYTEEMLSQPMTPELLAAQADPAGFLNARAAYVRRPTPAVMVTEYGGREYGRAPLNPQALATAADATRMYAHMVTLGMLPEVHIWESTPNLLAHRIEWNGEERRQYHVGPFSVGLLLLRYATTVTTLADRQTKQEIEAAGLMGKQV